MFRPHGGSFFLLNWKANHENSEDDKTTFEVQTNHTMRRQHSVVKISSTGKHTKIKRRFVISKAHGRCPGEEDYKQFEALQSLMLKYQRNGGTATQKIHGN
jgi:hypothetical protein